MNTRAIGILLLMLVGCRQEPEENLALKAHEFQDKLAATPGAVLLDVRTRDEVRQGYLKGAINFDFNTPEFNILIQGMDKSKPYFVYCASGVRSAKAADRMRDMDFVNVYTLDGGIEAWAAEGLPVQGQ